MTQRILVHFSCGAASAVAWKLTEERYGSTCNVEAIYCNMLEDEHPDNARFMCDVEEWVGKKVKLISNPKYTSIDEVFTDRQFMVTPYGAICTRLMKREVREKYQRPGDKHVFGLTTDEGERIKSFALRNTDLDCLWVLDIAGVTKADCYHMVSAAGIELPAMYKLGYGHNNCIGCVKGGKGYWNKIRVDFPEVFAKRATTQREIGCHFGGSRDPFYLDELDPEAGRDEPPQDIECGPFCLSSYGAKMDDAVSKLPLTVLTTAPAPQRLE